jgi:hypothetical protein
MAFIIFLTTIVAGNFIFPLVIMDIEKSLDDIIKGKNSRKFGKGGARRGAGGNFRGQGRGGLNKRGAGTVRSFRVANSVCPCPSWHQAILLMVFCRGLLRARLEAAGAGEEYVAACGCAR